MLAIHPVFHVSLLMKVKKDQVKHRKRPLLPAPPDIVEGEEQYDIKAIVDACIVNKGRRSERIEY